MRKMLHFETLSVLRFESTLYRRFSNISRGLKFDMAFFNATYMNLRLEFFVWSLKIKL